MTNLTKLIIYFSASNGRRKLPGDLKIRCGEYDLRSADIERYPSQDRFVETFTINPFYSGSDTRGNKFLRHDVAVIHTTKPFEKAPNVDTMCLPNPDEEFSDEACFSMGWGRNSIG